MFKLHWKNAHDDDFSRVFIYRSDSADFTADNSTKVGEVGGAKSQEMDWTNTVPDKNKTYYFALRSVDHGGNVSGIVSDPGVGLTEHLEGDVFGDGTGGGTMELPLEGAYDATGSVGDGEVLGEEDGDGNMDEEVLLNVGEEDEGLIKRVERFAREKTKLTFAILAGGAFVIAYLYNKRSKRK